MRRGHRETKDNSALSVVSALKDFDLNVDKVDIAVNIRANAMRSAIERSENAIMGSVMKKILLIVIPTLLFSSPLNESFTRTTFPPLGWRVINNDSVYGGLYTWERYTTNPRTSPACVSSRFENLSIRNDDWLITSKLICSPTSFDTLKFWYRKILPGTRESLEVRLSTTGNSINNFTTVLWDSGFTSTVYNQKVITLDGFDNQEIYIAFVNKGLYQGRINLDDITGPEMVEIKDVGVDSVFCPSAFIMRPFGIGFQPQARIKNYSNETQRNIPVICSIVGNSGIFAYVDVKYIDSLLIDSSTIVTFDSFVPTTAGVCTVKIRTLLANDINPNNNRKVRTIQIIRGNYTGGPDAGYGYWIDSDTTGGPIYNWNDISQTGTILPAGNEYISVAVPIDFIFSYYGEPKTHFWYSTNGFISLDTLYLSFNSNAQIPTSDLPNNIIAPFWDDLWTVGARHQSFGVSPNRYKVVQWKAVVHPGAIIERDTIVFQVIINENGDIVFQYNRCDNRYNLGQGQTATVGIENGSGTIGLQYLYNGIPEGNLLSSGRAIRFYRDCRDVTTDSILISSQVGLGEVVIPKVLVKNLGTEPESFNAIILIETSKDMVFSDTAEIIELNPANACTVNFDQWIPNQYGNYTVAAWTTLDNDFIRSNDTSRQNVEVSIAAPNLLNPPNNLYTNIMNQFFDWTDVSIATRYNFVVLNNTDTILYNTQYGPVNFQEGTYSWRVRAGTNDMWGIWSNMYTFTVDTTPPSAPVLVRPNPNCTLTTQHPNFIWRNVSDAAMYNLLVFTSSDTIIDQLLSDTFYISAQAFGNGTYFWKVRCHDLATNWSGFSSARTFLINNPVWFRKADVLEMNSFKPVSAGGSLIGIGNNLYALKGNNTQDFYAYDIVSNQWNRRCSIPFVTVGDVTIKRKVKAGGALVYANGFVFALKGNNTKEFWVYDTLANNWTNKKSIPVARGCKDGSSLTYFNGYIYCLVGGSDSFGFYRYDISQDSWTQLAPAPRGRANRRFKSGSCIAYGGNDNIYALKGNSNYNESYVYKISENIWQDIDSLPYYHPHIRKKTKTKAGGAMVFDGQHTIYTIKGGARNEFWKYNALTGQWSSIETIPRANKKSLPKAGASLAFADNRVWLLKGNKTRELWVYTPYESQNAKGKSQNCLINSVQNIESISHFSKQKDVYKIISVAGSLTKTSICYTLTDSKFIKINLYDIQGRLVKILKEQYVEVGDYNDIFTIDNLPKGVYFIVLDYENRQD